MKKKKKKIIYILMLVIILVIIFISSLYLKNALYNDEDATELWNKRVQSVTIDSSATKGSSE